MTAPSRFGRTLGRDEIGDELKELALAIEEFLSIPEEIRDKLYQKRVEQYEKRLAHHAPKSFGLPNTPSEEEVDVRENQTD